MIPLAGTELVGNTVTVRLRVHLIPVLENCVYDPANPLRLSDVAISFDGAGTPPTVVADFLPPVLHKLTVFVPGARCAVAGGIRCGGEARDFRCGAIQSGCGTGCRGWAEACSPRCSRRSC